MFNRQNFDPGFFRLKATVQDVDKREFTAEKTLVIGDRESLARETRLLAKNILESESLSRYSGWISYLSLLVDTYQQNDGEESERALSALLRLSW